VKGDDVVSIQRDKSHKMNNYKGFKMCVHYTTVSYSYLLEYVFRLKMIFLFQVCSLQSWGSNEMAMFWVATLAKDRHAGLQYPLTFLDSLCNQNK
jgi:hypothetical protein